MMAGPPGQIIKTSCKNTTKKQMGQIYIVGICRKVLVKLGRVIPRLAGVCDENDKKRQAQQCPNE
jgi:hypothetical protein